MTFPAAGDVTTGQTCSGCTSTPAESNLAFYSVGDQYMSWPLAGPTNHVPYVAGGGQMETSISVANFPDGVRLHLWFWDSVQFGAYELRYPYYTSQAGSYCTIATDGSSGVTSLYFFHTPPS